MTTRFGRLPAALLVVALLLAGASPARALEIQKVVSPGGIEAWLVEDHKVPVIAVEFSFAGGAAADPAGWRNLTPAARSEILGQVAQELRIARGDLMGAALAGVAGVMVTMYYGVIDFYIGFLAGIKAFTAAVLGGIGSLPGAMLGGLTIGMIEAFWSAYFSAEYKDVAAFAILVLVLIFRPTGLLGRPEIEKV